MASWLLPYNVTRVNENGATAYVEQLHGKRFNKELETIGAKIL